MQNKLSQTTLGILSLIAFLGMGPTHAFAQGSAETSPAVETKGEVHFDKKSDSKKVNAPKKDKKGNKKMTTGNTAIIKTTLGTIKVKLYKDKAPKTIENFVGLATGSKEWTDPKTGNKVKEKSLYEGTIFHRVIPDFMIQGGDPLGRGTGGPGYKFEDEFAATDNFDKPGLLAMANSGPGTNGSQFFITVKPTPWLNKKHTLFGEVTEGMDIVLKISQAERDGMDKPKTDIKIEKITIE